MVSEVGRPLLRVTVVAEVVASVQPFWLGWDRMSSSRRTLLPSSTNHLDSSADFLGPRREAEVSVATPNGAAEGEPKVQTALVTLVDSRSVAEVVEVPVAVSPLQRSQPVGLVVLVLRTLVPRPVGLLARRVRDRTAATAV